MKRKSKITKRELAAILRESAVAPNKPGPLKIIIDVGDVQYYMRRAMELVTLTLISPTVDQQEYYLEQAIFLLGVAKHTIRTNCEKKLAVITSADFNAQQETAKQAVDRIKGKECDCTPESELEDALKRVPGDPY